MTVRVRNTLALLTSIPLQKLLVYHSVIKGPQLEKKMKKINMLHRTSKLDFKK